MSTTPLAVVERGIDRSMEWRLPFYTEEQLKRDWSEDEWEVIERALRQMIPWLVYNHRTNVYKQYAHCMKKGRKWRHREIPESPPTPKGLRSADDIVVEAYGPANTNEEMRRQCFMLDTISQLAKTRGFYNTPTQTLRWRWNKSSPNRDKPLPDPVVIY